MIARLKRSLVKAIYFAVDKLVAYRDAKFKTAKWYPTCLGQNFLYDPMFPEADGKAYWGKFHAEKVINPLAVNFKQYKVDILRGKRIKAGENYQIEVKVPSALPYCITGVEKQDPYSHYKAEVTVGDKNLLLRNLAAERYYYLPIKEATTVKFKSPYDVIVADPIALKQEKKHKNRLVMVLFVDNFGWDVLPYIDFARDLPNLHKFFGDGIIFDNCYSASNWTLAGVAAIVSGQYLSRHNMFHAHKTDTFLGENYKVLPEYFQEDGYLTFQICGNTRKSPGYRYVKGYDRTVYRNEIPLCETFDVLYDHLRAFPERDHFVWITIMDAHHSLAEVPDITNQLQAPLEAADYFKPDEKSPLLLSNNPISRSRYIEELKRVDFHLGQMFNFLKSRYSDEEMMVSLVSDHGLGWLSDDPHHMSHQKAHVPFMLKESSLKGQRAEEIVHVVDILPSILGLNGYQSPVGIDGQLPKILGGERAREFAMSEIKFINAPYEATLKNQEVEFYFRTKAKVNDDGVIDLSEYTTELFLRPDWRHNVAELYPDLVRRYSDYVIGHISKL